ncbi:hypothetical protein Cadr_000007611 [Camelus dromedarius]|uniref:Uncharacterized protein n=1 Tax=Camelus dromedarius TaxID=9838 RepID=A0A5N4E6T3_CAMDR|nr:hypothetical protein Cadr_000007611 [Camelus dromedarius]
MEEVPKASFLPLSGVPPSQHPHMFTSLETPQLGF